MTVKANLVKRLLEAALGDDKAALRKSALQLAAAESQAGHTAVARQIREMIDRIGETSSPSAGSIDIAAPRGELAGLLEGGFREERRRDIVLSEAAESILSRTLVENRQRSLLEAHGLCPSRHLLFYGPPGCGKTLAASVIAGELGLPLFTVRFDALFSRFLGATAGHLKVIFDAMPRRPGVYFFDEFDAVGKHRDDSQDVGEIRRVVTSFLQMMDSDNGPSIIIAATNHEQLLDRALFRRFDTMLGFEMPEPPQVLQLLRLRLNAFRLPMKFFTPVLEHTAGLSFSDIARAIDATLRSMILDQRKRPSTEDLLEALIEARQRGTHLSQP